MAFKPTNSTPRKRKVTKRKPQFKKRKVGFTNFTTKKEKLSSGKYSSQTIIQELEALECFNLEGLLKSVKTLEESLQDLPSIEDTIAEVERLTEQMEKELEEYLNE